MARVRLRRFGRAPDIMDGYLSAILLFPAMSDLLGTAERAVLGLYGGIVPSISEHSAIRR